MQAGEFTAFTHGSSAHASRPKFCELIMLQMLPFWAAKSGGVCNELTAIKSVQNLTFNIWENYCMGLLFAILLQRVIKPRCFMSIKVKAVERELQVGSSAGQYRFIMQADLYGPFPRAKSSRRQLCVAASAKAPSMPLGRPSAKSSRHGPPRVTAWRCPDWARCASVCVPRV